MSKLNSYFTDDLIPKASQWTKRQLEKLNSVIDSSNGSIDWEMVATHVGDGKSAMECFMKYRNCTCPSINKGEWGAEEVELLTSLADKYDGHEWPLIAIQLGTGRTPLACLQYYQRHVNTKRMVNVAEFSSEEDTILLDTARFYPYHSHIHAARCIPSRAFYQCADRLRKLQPDATDEAERAYLEQVATARREQLNASGSRYQRAEGATATSTWTRQEEKMLFLAALAHKMPFNSNSKRPQAEVARLAALDTSATDEIRALVEGQIEAYSAPSSPSSGRKRRISEEGVIIPEGPASGRKRRISEEGVIIPEGPATKQTRGLVQGQGVGSNAPTTTSTAVATSTDSGTGVGVVADSSPNAAPHTNGRSASASASRKCWAGVAALLPGRTDIMCREKWSNALDPSLNLNVNYSSEEDALLLKLLPVIGVGKRVGMHLV